MGNQFENTNRLFDKIKEINIFQRLFGWKQIIALSMEAYSEFRNLDKDFEQLNSQYEEERQKSIDLEKDLKHETAAKNNLQHEVQKLNEDIDRYNKEIQQKEKLLGKLSESEDKNKAHIGNLQHEVQKLNEDIDRYNKEIQQKEKILGKLGESEEKNKVQIGSLQAKLQILESKKDDLIEQNKEIEKRLSGYEKAEKQKQKEYEDKVTALNSLKEHMDKDRQRIDEERKQEIEQRFTTMKEAWKVHETLVEQNIKQICKKYNIEYLDKEKVPFKGKPDNTLQIAGEFIIFDAKCPQNEDLESFPKYVKTQADQVKKYIKETNVKKDIYLVVPTNSIDKINETFYNLGEYSAYVVTIDSLEPIILSLKKIEEYEFAEALSPEDRDNICRILGRFAHATKRRIQVDQYFTSEFIDILTKAYCLPPDVLDKTIEFEKSGKLNPPQEKRVKQIDLKTLEKEKKRLGREAAAKNIDIKADMSKLEEVPLILEND